MQKVLFILSGIAYSGAEKVLEDYLDDNSLIDPVFLFVSKKDAFNYFESKYNKVFSMNLELSNFNLTFFPWHYFTLVKKIIEKIIEKYQIKIVYFNNTLESFLASKFITKNKEIKTICHIHDMKQSFRFFIKKYYIKKSLKNCKDSITVSKKCKESWDNLIHYVIHNGINPNVQIASQPKEKLITFIGSTNYRKGLDVFLECINHLNVLKNFKANIILNDHMIETSRPNTFIYCKITKQEVYDLLNKSKYLFVPSRHDPLPTIILEGIVMKNMVVGNRIDGIPEMLPNDFNLVENNSLIEYEKIFNKLENLSYEEFNKILLEQLEYVEKNFNLEYKKKKINEIIL